LLRHCRSEDEFIPVLAVREPALFLEPVYLDPDGGPFQFPAMRGIDPEQDLGNGQLSGFPYGFMISNSAGVSLGNSSFFIPQRLLDDTCR
jgi:hypothetical protein